MGSGSNESAALCYYCNFAVFWADAVFIRIMKQRMVFLGFARNIKNLFLFLEKTGCKTTGFLQYSGGISPADLNGGVIAAFNALEGYLPHRVGAADHFEPLLQFFII